MKQGFDLLLLFLALALALLFKGGEGLCPGQKLPEMPSDPRERGPFEVGLRTVKITERNLTVEIFYPAPAGSGVGRQKAQYSVRDEWLPPYQARKIPDEENPIQYIDGFFNLPLATSYSPFPCHLSVHGTAAWRTASAKILTHLASRGFVVFSADHPGINLKDMLSFNMRSDQEGDARLILKSLHTLDEEGLQFLKGHLDTSRIALSGHSAGGGAVGRMGDVANVVLPWCAWGVSPSSPSPQSSLILGAVDDGIARYAGQQSGYNTSPSPKRLVGVANSGHMLPTDLCWIGKELGGIVEIAKRNGIRLAYLFGPLGEDGCDEGQVKDERGWEIVNYINSAAQEEVLFCNPLMAKALREIDSVFPEIYEYKEML